MHEINVVGPGGECGCRGGQRAAVAIQSNDPGRAALQQRLRVATESDGAVDEEPAALGTQIMQRGAGENGNVSGQTPNSDKARASSSVYGSRCILLRSRS